MASIAPPLRAGCRQALLRKMGAPRLRTCPFFGIITSIRTCVPAIPTQQSKALSSLLWFAAVCSSSSHLHPVSKFAANPWGQIWVTDFGVGQGAFVGHGGSRRMGGALCVISRTDKARYLLEPEVRGAAVPVGDRLLVQPAPFLDGRVGGRSALYAPGSRSAFFCRANVPLSLL